MPPTRPEPDATRHYAERASHIPGALIWRAQSPALTERLILPDGCMDILWDGGTLVIAGPDTRAHVFASAAPSTIIGLRYAPGILPLLLGTPAHLLVNQRVPLAEVAPRPLTDALLLAVDGARAPGRALEAAWLPLLGELGATERGFPREALRLTRAGYGAAAAARALNLSERQLYRRSINTFGYGLRTLGRVLRLQDAVATLSRTPGIPLAQLAAEVGYTDQSHLTREFRSLAGVTPGDYLASHTPNYPAAAPPGSAANRSTALPSGSSTVA
ncbi:helix-turn-helix transcriptional regulator [Klugiella xanthotipulae]|uniref:AraC family transcriptional regulator n=1 Tax=Klugiella xanthotipulae TaxID=244735 RepID=UPI00114DCA13|nr:helix-turn-helix domain-containing protein [Klugiella xanthotipulae]